MERLPKQLEAHGLTAEQCVFADEIIKSLVASYTREAGVRGLERRVADLCRRVAVGVVKEEYTEKTLEADDVDEILGPPRYTPEVAERTEQPGVATGMAWTRSGGDLLFIEATRMPGKGKLTLTGQLGDVMKESAQAALSYLRSRAGDVGLDGREFEKFDLHVHVPAGAVPKDGPSAGITMLVALASLLTGKPVRPDLALSGEITLRGLVLPVGGIKNKVLAARRAGLKRIILPAKNEKDLEEVPEQVREGLDFTFVGEIAEVLEIALRDSEPDTTSATDAGTAKVKRPRRRKRGGTDKQPPAPQPS